MSSLYSTNVMDNEVVKAEDLTRGYDSTIDNVKFAVEALFTSNKEFVIGGKVKARTGDDMSFSIESVLGLAINDGRKDLILETDDINNAGSIENGWSVDRIDTIEIYTEMTESDEQQRAFIDFDTSSKTLANINVQKNNTLKVNVLTNPAGESVAIAPVHTPGHIKIAEVFVPANAISLSQCTIYPISADIPNLDNQDWTNEKQATYNLNTISKLRSDLRKVHKADGSFKENVIGLTNLIVNGVNQITGAGLPSGGTVTASEESKSSSILGTLTFLADKITDLYNLYLKNNALLGELVISKEGELDINTALKIASAGDGSASVKIGDNKIFDITQERRLRMASGYTPNNDLDVVTKAITDAISTAVRQNTEAIINIIIENTPDAINGDQLTVNGVSVNIENAKSANKATSADITKTADTTNGDKLQIGSGTSINVTNSAHAKTADSATTATTAKKIPVGTPSGTLENGMIWVV